LAISSESEDDDWGVGSENDADTYVYTMQYSTLKTATKKHGFRGAVP